MARKTNKTAHVLNLISKAKESYQTLDDDFEINTIKNSSTDDLSFVDLQLSNDTEISEQIKENLSKLISNENSNSNKTENYDSMSETTNCIDDIDESTTNILSDNEIKNEKENSDLDSKIATDTIDKHIDTELENSLTNVQVAYCYVNVIEEIVKSSVDEFLISFDVCSCPRCKADVTALALNGLPPKYIVVDKSHMSPLLNFFSVKYRSSVTAQLSKACIIVKENPHH